VGLLWGCEDDDPSTPLHEHTAVSAQVQPALVTLTAGATSTLHASALCGCGASIDESFSWTSSDPSIASVTASGLVTAKSFGSATIRAEAGTIGAEASVVVLPEGVVIGPAGGTVTSADGTLVLEVPAGALAQEVDIVVEKLDDAAFLGDPFFIPGTAFQVRPDALQLLQQARVRIRYDADHVPDGVDPDRLRLRQRTAAQWAATTGHQHRVQTREVEGTVGSFGTFGLLAIAGGHWVGPAGATLSSADGLLELEIPPGALDEWADVTLDPAEDASFAGDPAYVPGTSWAIGPDRLQLQERARLRIHYDPDLVPAVLDHDRLRIRERDRDQNRWNATHENQAHPAQNRVEARLERFGTFAIVGEPVGALVGPEGAVITIDDGALEIIVPAGALASVADIAATRVDDAVFAGDASFVPGTAWEMSPHGIQFQREVTLRIRYDPANLPAGTTPQHLRLRLHDAQGQQWRETQRNRLRLQEHAVEGDVWHFSTFALVRAPVGEGPVASVTVLPVGWQVDAGQQVQLSLDVRDIYGTLLSRTAVWNTSDAAVATVDVNGLVTGVTEGDVVISASVDGVTGSAAGKVMKGKDPVASVTLIPASLALGIGETGTFTAELRDATGTLLSGRAVSWNSGSPTVATVSQTGVVTGVGAGTTTITATSEGVSGSGDVSVAPPIALLQISDPGHEPLEIGLTKQLDATAWDAVGNVVPVVFTWTSSDESLATVDATGLVTGVGRGVVTITAAAMGLSDAVDIRVVGEGGAYGNNLSWPVVFADGIGITGQPVATDPGIRPTTAENVAVTGLPFFWDQNVPTYGIYFEQQTFNTWVAEWIDGSQGPPVEAQITWGDNLTHMTWSASRPIRVEQVLSATAVGTLAGYNMTYLYGQGPGEMQGTDGTTGDFIPTVYTVGPTLTIERISGPGGSVLATVASQPVGSEVNVVGKIIYGYNLWLFDWTPPTGVTPDGWYRITFEVAPGGHVALTTVGNVGDDLTYVPEIDPANNRSWIEIFVKP
jgi:uncharacterized protein YjdB